MSDNYLTRSDAPSLTGGGNSPQLTGRMVFFCLLTFFGVVVVVNSIMIHEALSTFGGLETESSYKAGRMFEQEVTMARAQDVRQWRVEAKITPAADGARLDIDARDAAGRPLTGIDATAVFERPTDRRLDRDVAVNESEAGHFHGSAMIPAGQWDLVVELWHQGERQFRSKNRVVLR